MVGFSEVLNAPVSRMVQMVCFISAEVIINRRNRVNVFASVGL